MCIVRKRMHSILKYDVGLVPFSLSRYSYEISKFSSWGIGPSQEPLLGGYSLVHFIQLCGCNYVGYDTGTMAFSRTDTLDQR